MAVSDLTEALRNTRGMDCYLEARSAQEIIQDFSEALARAANTATLRDHFAGHALAGILCNYAASAAIGRYAAEHNIAESAYEYADAMLAERERAK